LPALSLHEITRHERDSIARPGDGRFAGKTRQYGL